ncbi:MAG: LTA synthase family protein [Vicinamibacteria bacterium]|nr:LTA synthase family protein [Vicinamibacteria bacterium]
MTEPTPTPAPPEPAPARLARLGGFRLGAALVPVLIAAKAAHWGVPRAEYISLRDFVRDLFASAAADLAFALGFGLLAAGLLGLARRRAHRGRVAEAVLLATGAFVAIYSVASVQIFSFLRSPLTYPLLYLAGDMQSMRSSISAFVTPGVAAGILAAPLFYVWLATGDWPRVRRVRPLLIGLAVAWAALGLQYADGRWKDRADHLIARSPHWAFLASLPLALHSQGPTLEEAFDPDDLTDFRPGEARSGFDPGGRARPKNVILVVMESTGAKYLSLYGSRYPTTPNLGAEARHALVFENIYAHVGLTANSLVSMMLSIYPYMTWREYTVEYPTFPGETLAQVLKHRGYRTAFLESGYLDYVAQDKFLANRGFDRLEDWDDLGDGPAVNSWGGHDRALVDRALRYAEEDPATPFYAVLWSVQSHHPYDPVPGQPEIDFFQPGPRPDNWWDLGRYLNTVADVDRQLGRLFAGLRERGLDKDTIVMVTGDHGQAFGDPHPTWGHGFRVYQENVHVPLVVWAPGLFAEERRVATIGGHVDLAPTLADMLGIKPSPTWQGRSLFHPTRPPRAYFYAVNDDYLLGVREGRFKYVYNATRGSDELFDLVADPDEQRNVAEQNRELVRRLRRRVAAWRHHAAEHLEGARVVK